MRYTIYTIYSTMCRGFVVDTVSTFKIYTKILYFKLSPCSECCMLFFWVILLRLNFICRRFETLCSIFIGGVTIPWLPFLTQTKRRFSLTYVILAFTWGPRPPQSVSVLGPAPPPPVTLLPIGSGYFRAKTFSV